MESITGDILESVKKDYINYNKLSDPITGVLFTDFITDIVNKKTKRLGRSYYGNYKTLIYHLNNFSKENDVILYINSINEEFLDDFIDYLEQLNLRVTYIKNLLCLTKAMVKKAALYGYRVDSSYDNVTVKDEDVFSIYLSLNDITRIYYFKGLTRKQELIKDLFVVGCLSALRYSDYSNLHKGDFVDGFINKLTKKTNKRVIIPMHDYIHEIYKKYDGEIGSRLSVQHFNRYIKLICKKVGFTEDVSLSYTVGGEIRTEVKPKWQLISSHTARRSAATNMYLTGRMKTYEIMQLTGHTTERCFFKYIKVSQNNMAKQISSDNYFRK